MALQLVRAVLILSILGIFDASYLTFEHFSGNTPPCSASIWVDCGRVLKSEYATIWGFPVAMLGLAFYSSMAGLMLVRLYTEKKPTFKDWIWKMVGAFARPREWTLEKMLFYGQLGAAVSAAVFSLYFIFIQLVVIEAICLYCMLSAVLSFSILSVTVTEWWKYHK